MALWQAVAAVALCHVTGACNVRELGEIIRKRFQQEVVSDCGAGGDKCTFDRDCCFGLECRMAVTKGGVDNYCQTRIEAPTTNLADIPPLPEEAPAANQPSSDEDGAWMMASLVGSEEHEGVATPTDTWGEIDGLQAKKRAKLLKENQDLERLFTEKEEKELEMLRSLKEDAEVDELRRLKELRLKRKLQLLKEIRELKALQAEEDLNRIDKLKEKTKKKERETATITVEKEGVVEAVNETNPIEEEPQQETERDVPAENKEEPNNEAELAQAIQDEPEQTQEPDTSTHKHKQGIHEAHHRRKHHQHKQRNKQTPPLNSTEPIENTETVTNAEEAAQGSNA